MAKSDVLPRSAVAFRDALRPISSMLGASLSEAPARSMHCADAVLFVQDHLDWANRHVQTLVDEVNGDVARVAGADVVDADVWRAVSRLEVQIERMLDRYDRVRRTSADGEDGAGLLLLGDLYRRLLRQMEAWINDIIAFVDDPITVAERRGAATAGQVAVDIRLTLDAAPQLSSVLDWLDEQEDANAKRREWKLTGLLLGSFGLGLLLGGDDCDV